MPSSFMIAEKRKRVGVLAIPLVFLAPRRLFERVENVTGYGSALLVLLGLLTLAGYVTIETGLIDNVVRERSAKRQSELEKQHEDVGQRATLIKLLEDDRKKAEFERLMTRLQKVVAAPVGELASMLLISAALYGMVALGGRKPEWHTLLTICVFAGFVDVVASFTRLGLMLQYGLLDVDTSAGLLAPLLPSCFGEVGSRSRAVVAHVLTGFEPFRMWFWVLVLVGVSVTAQLSRWRARIGCLLLWLISSGGHIALSFATMSSSGGGSGTGT
jgi:hypothetical protein